MIIVIVYLVINGLVFEFILLNLFDYYFVMVGIIFFMNVFICINM